MVDIVDIALDALTDFADFEKLACEVLHNIGFNDIQPLGGVADSGQDAVVERFYYRKSKRTRIVFQITTQETIESKLRQTIERLEECDIEYTELHLVTSRNLTAARQTRLTGIARELDVPLTITERKKLSLELSDYSNGIFHRHFPDPEKQLKIFEAARQPEPLSQERLLHRAMTFTSLPETEQARRRVLRELILALLISVDSDTITPRNLIEIHDRLLPAADSLEPDQIASVLDHWVREGLVEEPRPGHYSPTLGGTTRAAAAEMFWQQHGLALALDIADSVEEAIGKELNSTDRRLVERNGSEVITQVFRLFGLELSSQLLGNTMARGPQVGSHESIVATAGRDLVAPLGEVLTAALGELLAKPSDEQADSLNALALGYLGASLVQLDPAVRELQRTRIREKIFILDTDFLLDCIVSHQPRQRASKDLVRSLTAMGAKVIVPSVCISEAAAHASISQRTVDYFGESIFALSASQAAERINNMFARGWYFRVQQGGPVLFESYLQNYLEPRDPYGFMASVVKAELPEEVEIGDVADLLEVEHDEDTVSILAIHLVFFLNQSKKSVYRTPEEVEALARTDAQLYVAAAAAGSSSTLSAGRVLGRRCYLITSSTRFIRAVDRAFNSPDEVSARPDTLTGLMQLVGQSDVTPKQFMALFDNPLLQASVANSWPDIEELLSAGLSLKDKNQARLTWDLEDGLHQRIAAVTASEARADDKPVLQLLDEARRRDYKPSPYAEALFSEVKPLRADNTRLTEELDDLGQRFDALQSEIERFGRRRQRYLQRVAKGQRQPKRG